MAYIVSHSYPYSSNGYAVRTHGISKAFAESGNSIIVINRPGRPWDIPGFSDKDFALHHEIEGVRYLHLPDPSIKSLTHNAWQEKAVDAIEATLRIFKPSVVMAASNWQNALPAMLAARRLNLPFYYEVRGFWELSQASRDPTWRNTNDFEIHLQKEKLVAQRADKVFTLNEPMREELVNRGVDRNIIEILPNAFTPAYGYSSKSSIVTQFSRPNTEYVVGYIGSFNEYEGLDDLIRSCAAARRQGIDLTLLMVGSSSPQGLEQSDKHSAASEQFVQVAQSVGFNDYLKIVGRVKPEHAINYYKLIDLIVIPRKPAPVCELVPPLKPIEAAAHGKPVLMSDVKALFDLNNEGGLYYYFRKGSEESLTTELIKLLQSKTIKEAPLRPVHSPTWRESIATLLDAIPTFHNAAYLDPRGIAPMTKSRLRIACVMDEFTYQSYAPECELFELTPASVIGELDSFCPDLLFIESAWRGKEDLWSRKIANVSPELKSALEWCKKKSIPTVFWNKEDPIHFETFLTTAQHFDYVFTTDIDCIGRYKAALGHDKVYLLPFACQPQLHNPIELYHRKDAFSFAGAYYVRYPERTRDLEDYVAQLPNFRPIEIFDRNFGKSDPNYQFPVEYQPYIVGTLAFNEIDKAYKGYRFSINLNSIKQSQSMFARRVYELLASNTITVSNFSKGIRLLFGDLIITTDSGLEMTKRLNQIAADDNASGKLRLQGLRKVMREHTYAHRLAYIAEKALQMPVVDPLPELVVTAQVFSREGLTALIENFTRQEYSKKRLVLVADKDIASRTISNIEVSTSIIVLDPSRAGNLTTTSIMRPEEWLAPMLSSDYYGPHYLQDIALATRYSNASVIGKSAYYAANHQGQIELLSVEDEYKFVETIPARAGAIFYDEVVPQPLATFLRQLPNIRFRSQRALAVDRYNYCRDAERLNSLNQTSSVLDDLPFDTGLPVYELLKSAEKIPALENKELDDLGINANALASHFGDFKSEHVTSHLAMGNWRIKSTLADNKHDYIYAPNLLKAEEICENGALKTYLDISPGLNIQLVLFFIDANRQKIHHVIQTPNRNHITEVPANTEHIRLGIRVYGQGEADIKKLHWQHRVLEPSELLGRSDYLLVTNNYPSYGDLYRNGFVHSRICAYRELGLKVDVFRLLNDAPISYHEFQNVDVTTGSISALENLLASGRYKTILVHFLNPSMWKVLKNYINKVCVIVWVHGVEAQAWHRRAFNYADDSERAQAKLASNIRMAFWKELIENTSSNLHFVFVSQYLASTVMEDVGTQIQKHKYSIIHNAIDVNLFKYKKKTDDFKSKILSIRPYTSKVYANDLMVKAILLLRKKEYFDKLCFHLIGDGKLFEETLLPLRNFKNVIIEKRFLTREEIADLHTQYGIFLCPSRMDTQGVSRDEAMSSGLVPVTNRVAAIPQFVDESCGILAENEDAIGLAEGIARLYEQPGLFLTLSQNAAARVRRQSASDNMIKSEMEVIHGKFHNPYVTTLN